MSESNERYRPIHVCHDHIVHVSCRRWALPGAWQPLSCEGQMLEPIKSLGTQRQLASILTFDYCFVMGLRVTALAWQQLLAWDATLSMWAIHAHATQLLLQGSVLDMALTLQSSMLRNMDHGSRGLMVWYRQFMIILAKSCGAVQRMCCSLMIEVIKVTAVAKDLIQHKPTCSVSLIWVL